MEQSDEAAVALAQAGDSNAFRVLVERHSRTLFRVAYRMTGNEQDAEDVVQESLLRAFRQLATFDSRASFRTWLYRIAVNCSLDRVRVKKRWPEQKSLPDGEMEDPVLSIAAGDPTPDRIAESSEIRRHVEQAMEDLSAAERTAFVLRHYEGLCIEDVSRVLGCQPGAAKHCVFRAVQKLRRALEPLVSTAR